MGFDDFLIMVWKFVVYVVTRPYYILIAFAMVMGLLELLFPNKFRIHK